MRKSGKYFGDINNQRIFMNDLANKLDISAPEQWYKITTKSLIHHGGEELLSLYNHSPLKLLNAIYPKYPTFNEIYSFIFLLYKWDPSKFEVEPPRLLTVWHNVSYQRSFMNNLAQTLHITDNEDWYKITGQDVLDNGGFPLLMLYRGSLSQLLRTVYPEYHKQYIIIC